MRVTRTGAPSWGSAPKGRASSRATRSAVASPSTEGGVEIEKVAADTPEKILTVHVDPIVGLAGFQARDVAAEVPELERVLQRRDIVLELHLRALVEGQVKLLLELRGAQDGQVLRGLLLLVGHLRGAPGR